MLEGFAMGPWTLVDVHAPTVGMLKAAQSTTVRRIRKLDSLHPERLPDLPPEHEYLLEEATPTKLEEAKRKSWKLLVQSHMADAFNESAETMDDMLARGDTTNYWYKWCECVETAYVRARNLDQQDEKRVRGRGHVQFEMVTTHDHTTLLPADGDEWTQHRAENVHKPQRAIRMLLQLLNIGRKRATQPRWSDEMRELWSAIRRKHLDQLDSNFIGNMDQYPYHAKMHFQVNKEVARIKQEITINKRKITKQKQNQLKERLQGGPAAEKEAYGLVRKPMAPGMLFLEVTPGCITAQPDLIDEATIAAWTKVYDGNEEDHDFMVKRFLRKYGQHLYVSHQPAVVPEFTKEMILQDCAEASASEPGWDQWQAADWRRLDDHAAQRLADLLNGIESGLDWPELMF